jgi:hypothetical protein
LLNRNPKLITLAVWALDSYSKAGSHHQEGNPGLRLQLPFKMVQLA